MHRMRTIEREVVQIVHVIMGWVMFIFDLTWTGCIGEGICDD